TAARGSAGARDDEGPDGLLEDRMNRPPEGKVPSWGFGEAVDVEVLPTERALEIRPDRGVAERGGGGHGVGRGRRVKPSPAGRKWLEAGADGRLFQDR